MLNVLITGGAGFIGSSLALKLKEMGYSVTVLDNLSPQIHGDKPAFTSPLYSSIKNKIKFIFGDVTDRKLMDKIIHEFDIICHFAAETGTGQSMYEMSRYTNVNIVGTATLLDIIANKKNRIKKIILASSRAVYGEGKYLSKKLGVVYPSKRKEEDLKKGDFEVKYKNINEILKPLPTDEESLVNPVSIYGITKHVQEKLLMTISDVKGIPYVILRYQNVYGPGQSLINPYTGILAIFATRIIKGEPIDIFEDGKESRDFVFIDDAIEATILSIENNNANGQIFNVGTGIPINVITVAEELMKNLDKIVPLKISGKFRLGDIRHNFADISKINSYLNYKPKICFKDGIKKFTDWVRTQKIQKDNYRKSLEELKARGLFK